MSLVLADFVAEVADEESGRWRRWPNLFLLSSASN
jgi:hypothetical protein